MLRALAAPVFLQWPKILRCLAKGIAAVDELRSKSETMNWKGADFSELSPQLRQGLLWLASRLQNLR
ncbi:hypothetical protein [Aliiroseovarius sp.]|uniref:hypothetical protein n=1 Tax=Aliiroseovarius sp. TaxID=1872442 RepID=UPI003BA93E48